MRSGALIGLNRSRRGGYHGCVSPAQTTRGPEPYGSAADLPSYRELLRQIQGMKLLTLVISRKQRSQVLELEARAKRLVQVVDAFYARLGARNWIFHDHLDVSKLAAILAKTSDAEVAEVCLIELHRELVVSNLGIQRFLGHEGLRARFHQIERARDHYLAGQFDSCVLQLVAVMDGFVNDFEPGVRKGLVARDPEDMTAWDSVVGHHLGLTHALATFGKTLKKRVEEEVFEVYRHGIVHGSVVRFDNTVVATKAWNMLYAVADWATATLKAAVPPEPQPTLKDTWNTLTRHAAFKKREKEFVASTTVVGSTGFEQDEIVVRASEFLDAWSNGRWAMVADFIPGILRRKSKHENVLWAKESLEGYAIANWAIQSLSRDMAAAAQVGATCSVNGQAMTMSFRMTFQTEDGNIALPGDADAAWRVAIWAPHTYFTERA